jgi:hypothetical protein
VEGSTNRVITDSANDSDVRAKYQDARARYETAMDVVRSAGEVRDETWAFSISRVERLVERLRVSEG